jgi:membrane protein DedA with SNARE-associated domain
MTGNVRLRFGAVFVTQLNCAVYLRVHGALKAASHHRISGRFLWAFCGATLGKNVSYWVVKTNCSLL